MPRFIDLTGQTFGNWKVLNYRGHSKWLCECVCEKHTKRVVIGANLRNGRSTSCGCKHNQDLVGMIFGKLTVKSLHHVDVSNFKNYWLCECSCSNHTQIVVSTNQLKSGHTKSCGCLRAELNSGVKHDITGQRFGELTAIRHIGMNKFRKSLWYCECQCGGHCITTLSCLVGGYTKTCGHNTQVFGSYAENAIKTYIQNLLPDTYLEKASHILNGREIDIYLPEYKFGVEYNGSAFHATENGAFSDKDKYYHRDKFLLAREKGIHLITVFDIDYETNKLDIFNNISNILLNNNYEPFIPKDEIVYTNNDFDDGLWLLKYGYKEVGQEEPAYFIYNNKYKVYRCGRTIWRK